MVSFSAAPIVKRWSSGQMGSLSGVRRYFVPFVNELKSRRVEIAGIHHQPYGAWVEQVARKLTDVF